MTPDNEKILVDPRKFSEEDLPMIVFSSDSNALISWIIRVVSKGLYNHVMWLIPNGFASQSFTFRLVPIKKYLIKEVKLKFFKIKDLAEDERLAIYTLIGNRLNLPWWKRRYDFLGILGQATGLRWINNPWTYYCSEQMANDITKTITYIRGKRNPEELEEIVKNHPRFEYVGHWIGD